jgi:hypothetical protein
VGGEINLFKVSGSKFKVEILLFRICGKACAPAKPKANKNGFIIPSIILIGFQILNESVSGLFHTYACSQIRTRRGIGHFRIVNFSKTGLLRQAQDDLSRLSMLTLYLKTPFPCRKPYRRGIIWIFFAKVFCSISSFLPARSFASFLFR